MLGMAQFKSSKSDVRKDAFQRRRAAFRAGEDGSACQNLIRYVADHPEFQVISAYLPIRTEIDPVPAMRELHRLGHDVCVPVIQGAGKPLIFREWSEDADLIEGDFGAMIPRTGRILQPDLVVAPLVAFDRKGFRLGYGGGFYDRSLSALRKQKSVTAIGFAFAAQERDLIPTEKTDEQLDGIITENGIFQVGPTAV